MAKSIYLSIYMKCTKMPGNPMGFREMAKFVGLQPHLGGGAGAAGMAWVAGPTHMQPAAAVGPPGILCEFLEIH